MPLNLTSPEPIRTDETNAFANNTMKVRIPAIIEDTLQLDPSYPESIKTSLTELQTAVANGHRIPSLDIQTAPDYVQWLTALEQQQVMVDTPLTWHNAQWFFAETYVYRYIIQAVRWYETKLDPFLPKKRIELEGDALWTLLDKALERSGTVDEQFLACVAFDLWGNRIDLSYEASLARGTDISDDDLLVDDRLLLLDHLHKTASESGSLKGVGDVYIIADNAGSELMMDLVLIDFMLQHVTDSVILHVKSHPTFVSDAIPKDIWMTLAEMRSHGASANALATRLTDAWNNGQLKIAPHPFWNSSFFMWDMPMTLHNLMDTARLVIIKGDANYRRAIGDSVWAVDTPFADVMSYLNAPVMCLRTLKSDPIVGLPSLETEAKLENDDPQWRTNGKRGVIQFKPYTSNTQ
jgi:damage-control phosphatase, subfamily III